MNTTPIGPSTSVPDACLRVGAALSRCDSVEDAIRRIANMGFAEAGTEGNRFIRGITADPPGAIPRVLRQLQLEIEYSDRPFRCLAISINEVLTGL